ncbi:MAG: DDE-type integrase/transposase/recombinase [Vicinamibacteria bacterium]
MVHSSGNIELAIQNGVPRSTAKDWLRRPTPTIVTLDVTAMTEDALREEVAALRQRNDRLIAVLRLLVVLLRISGFTLARCRVADGSKKALLLRAVENSRSSLSLRSALRILKLSATRYHSWKREESCALQDVSSCPRTFPHQLTSAEVAVVKNMVTSEEYRHVPTGTLALLAQRLGKVVASPATWYRLVRLHRWRRPRRRVHPAKPKVGIRASRPNQFWHVDTTMIRLLDGTRAYLNAVIDNFSRRILAWRVSERLEAGNTVSVLLEASRQVLPSDEPPTLLTDGGVENFNASVDELIESGLLRRLLAMTEISFSNSLIEAWWRALKHQWLYLNSLDSVPTVEKLVSFYIDEHNTRLPHSAFRGQTPDEMYFGTGDHVPVELEAAKKAARQARLEKNRQVTCATCE